MYEHFEAYILVDLVGPGHCLVQFDQRLMVVILSINDKDKSPTTTKDVLRVKGRVKEVDLPRKVPNLKRETLLCRDLHIVTTHVCRCVMP